MVHTDRVIYRRAARLLVVFALAIIVVDTTVAQEQPPSGTAEVMPQAATVEDSTATGSADTSQVSGVPQRDVIDLLNKWLFGRRIEPALGGTLPGISWSILPTLSYNPVYGFAVGASATGGGVRGSGPHAVPSVISLSANYSTQGQTQALVRIETATSGGSYLLKADVRYLDTDRSTWGLGPISEDQQEYPMHFLLLRTYATVYRRTAGPVYVGLGYRFDDFSEIEDKRAIQGEATPFSDYSGVGVTRTRASGISLDLLADTRDSIVNPMRGYYLNGSFRSYLEDLGSDRFWQEFWIAAQMYARVPKKKNNILAFWLYGWFTYGPGPYLNLPAVGWDTYGRGARGYLQGRIRSSNQIYMESEYRFQLTKDGLLGGVVFINATTSTITERGVFGKIDPAGGLGIRIKFNKHSRANLALDHAWGRAGSRGWFMGMSEAF